MFASFKLRLAAYFVVLAVLPLGAAFWGFSSVLERAEEQRVDSRLEAELRAATAAYTRELAGRTDSARRLAQSAPLQRALERRDRAAISRLLRGGRGVRVVAQGLAVGPRPRFAATRAVRIRGGRVAGKAVVAVLPLDEALLARLGRQAAVVDADRLLVIRSGRPISLVAQRPATAEIADEAYRALATRPLPEQPRARLAVLAPAAAIDSASASARRRLLFALLAGLVLVALVALAEGRSVIRSIGELAQTVSAIGQGELDRRAPVRGRDEFARLARAFNEMADQLRTRLQELEAQRRRLRDSITSFGRALGATHDRTQLLPVIAEATAEAAGASGALLVTDAGAVVEVGNLDPTVERDEVEVPLAAGSARFGTILLFGREFAEESIAAARSLAAQAAVALENARLHEVVEEQALADGLTGLANRRRCEQVLAAEAARADRYGADLSIVLCDIDDFKAANDRYGHAAGDAVLRELATVLRGVMRDLDVAGRWGGEEFVVILPGTDAAGAADAADRIRRAFASRTVSTPGGAQLQVTASFGVASYAPGTTVAGLVEAADGALYAAKRAGKNRVEVAAVPAL